MKKIMIALAAVAMAVASQAAVVNWNSGNIVDSTGAIPTANKITAYLYTIDNDAFTTYSAMDAAKLSQTIGQAFVDGTLGTVEKDGKNTYSTRGGAKATADLIGTTQYSAGNTAYGLVLYVDEAKELYMANVASVTFASSQNATVSNLSNVLGGGATGTATSWQAVPEPTSGLLMLLGMAGLALRRRRA